MSQNRIRIDPAPHAPRADPNAETKVPCPACALGLVSAEDARALRKILEDAGWLPER